MGELLSLHDYVPENLEIARLDLREDLVPVVERLSDRIPSPKIWDLFSSSPSETGGRTVFPYCRVDGELVVAGTYIHLLTSFQNTPEDFARYYEGASGSAFKAVAWVDIGFQGLENLARSPASVNWTSGVGHIVTPEQRAIGIMTGGKKLYDSALRKFTDFRTRSRSEIESDAFIEFESEDLLEQFT